MASHSSILAWRIPLTEEPGRLWSMGLKESDTTERLSAHTHIYYSQDWKENTATNVILNLLELILLTLLKNKHETLIHLTKQPTGMFGIPIVYTAQVELLISRKLVIYLFTYLFVGHARCLVGSQFPDQGLNPGPQQ